MTTALIEGQKILKYGKSEYIPNENQEVIEITKLFPQIDGRIARKNEVYYDGKDIVVKTSEMLQTELQEKTLFLKNRELNNKLIELLRAVITEGGNFTDLLSKVNNEIAKG